MHPAYPQQVQFSYYQASLVCELIARDYGGDAAILKMLQAYKAGQTTDAGLQERARHRHEGLRQEVRRLSARALRRRAAVDRRHSGRADDKPPIAAR